MHYRLGGARSVAVALLIAARPASAEFFMGADVSLLPFMQQQNVAFKANGVAKPADTILYDAGANLFRVRLFVNPQTTYSNTNYGAVQSQSYAIALAQQLKSHAPGAKLLLDLHYSDTWADPGQQTLPQAWAGQSLAQLRSTVQTYTADTLTAFKAAGVMPHMVQIGNETNGGMLWPVGAINFNGTTAAQKTSWAAYGSLVRAAIAGVQQAQGTGTRPQIALHIANGDNAGGPQYFFDKLGDPAYGNVDAASFDTIGLSFYPNAAADMATLRTNMTDLASEYGKKLMVMETNAPWKSTSNASDPAYADTPAGQLRFLTDLRTLVEGLPNDLGQGVMYWYPEAVQVAGYNIYNGGTTALFDTSGNALPALAAFAVPEPATLAVIATANLLLLRRRRVAD
ncbi:MAG TPA: glycosyl hydrolase 53 family protein [Tepidisphaeraceae bacterium]|jgi:arabinogalactan endo-1,4-beta-galactosidase